MKKTLKIISGFLISALFVYLAFRRIDVSEALSVFFSVNIYYVLLSLAVSILGLFVRSFRWRILLSYQEKAKEMPVANFFEATCVGQMINNVLPFRMGDIAQAVFLAIKQGFSKSAVFSTVIMERLVDIFPPMIIIFLGSFFVLLPESIGTGRVFIVMGIVVFGLAFLMFFQSHLKAILKKIFPKEGKFSERLHKLIDHFYLAAGFLKDKKRLIPVLLFTVLLWSVYALSAYFLMLSVNLNRGYFGGMLVLGITAIGVAIPSSPGYIGTWEFFCILALRILKIKKSMALSFAILYHLMSYIPVTLIGAVVLFKSGISFAKLEESVTTDTVE
ncbi:MAG: lysylphosphatidylglycerol synthase transmembrane domain-containing protein [Elusimicrobiota bacterium]